MNVEKAVKFLKSKETIKFLILLLLFYLYFILERLFKISGIYFGVFALMSIVGFYFSLILKNKITFFIYSIALLFFLFGFTTYIHYGSILLPNDQSFYITRSLQLESLTTVARKGALLIFFAIIFPKINDKPKIIIVLISILLFISIQMIMSLIVERNVYLIIIKSGFVSDERISGVFSGPNGFGYNLLIASAACILLYEIIKNKFLFIYLIPTGLILLCTFSKTNIILFFLLLFVYFTYKFICYLIMKSNKKLTIVAVGSICVCAIAVFLIIFLIKDNVFYKILNKIYVSGSKVLEKRFLIWKNVFSMLNMRGFTGWLFGFSSVIFGKCLNIAYTHDPDFSDSLNISGAHNGLISDLGIGGIVFLILDLLLLGLICSLILRERKKDKIKFILILLALIVLMEHLVEDFSLLMACDSIMYMLYLLLFSCLCSSAFNMAVTNEKI